MLTNDVESNTNIDRINELEKSLELFKTVASVRLKQVQLLSLKLKHSDIEVNRLQNIIKNKEVADIIEERNFLRSKNKSLVNKVSIIENEVKMNEETYRARIEYLIKEREELVKRTLGWAWDAPVSDEDIGDFVRRGMNYVLYGEHT